MRALAKAKEVCESRSAIAQELKGQGKKVMGYLCCYSPVEIMTAAGVVPYRMTGSVNEPITQADTYVDACTCPFVRSCFDIAFKGWYDFLDGVVVPHACDHIERTYPVWRFYLKLSYSHFINIPHVVHPASYTFFKAELDTFKKSLEELTGTEISNQGLVEAIRLHNENRSLLRRLCQLRKQDPPSLSGTEMMQVLIAAMSIPVAKCNNLLKDIIDEVEQRPEDPHKRGLRVLIYGGPIDDSAFVQLIEESGASVVMDDSCIGTRHYWQDVKVTDDPLDGLSSRYLDETHCPRTFRETKAKETLSYLLDYAREFGVNGIITYSVRYCDSHAYDLPDLGDIFKGAGLPVLHLLDDYNMTSMARLRTRIEAFLEMIG